MRWRSIYVKSALVVLLSVLFVPPLTTCEEATQQLLPGGDQDAVFNADGGFVITQRMLDQPYNRITFPGTHNSFAGPNWHDACGNQDLSIQEQLFYGIRYIELDVDWEGCASHNGYCTQPLIPLLNDISEFARTHPSQIITVRISDLACDRRFNMGCAYLDSPLDASANYCGGIAFRNCCHPTPPPEQFYAKINTDLKSTRLPERIYNWNASIRDNSDPAKCYVPDSWPTLGEMIFSGRNVMFFHHRDVHDIVDSGYFRSLIQCEYFSYACHDMYRSYQLADLSKIQPMWDPGICARQKDGYNRLFLLECNALYQKHCHTTDQHVFDTWTDCPGRERATNDGRRHYQLAKQHEEDLRLLPSDRIVNFIAVDYYMSNQNFRGGYREPIDVVDACNRLNYERFGFEWRDSYYAWEIEPYEFDPSKVEYIRRIPALRNEVEDAIDDFQSKAGGLNFHEIQGAIVSTPVYVQESQSEKGPPTDWLWLPEWAVDDDYYTAWRGADWSGSLGIDLGAAKPIDEIAIAWKYSYIAPGYTVYVSNADEFAGSLWNAIKGTTGWTEVAQVPARWPNPPQAWDRVTFDLNSWRYIKIELNEAGRDLGSAIFELRGYGPAN